MYTVVTDFFYRGDWRLGSTAHAHEVIWTSYCEQDSRWQAQPRVVY